MVIAISGVEPLRTHVDLTVAKRPPIVLGSLALWFLRYPRQQRAKMLIGPFSTPISHSAVGP